MLVILILHTSMRIYDTLNNILSSSLESNLKWRMSHFSLVYTLCWLCFHYPLSSSIPCTQGSGLAAESNFCKTVTLRVVLAYFLLYFKIVLRRVLAFHFWHHLIPFTSLSGISHSSIRKKNVFFSNLHSFLERSFVQIFPPIFFFATNCVYRSILEAAAHERAKKNQHRIVHGSTRVHQWLSPFFV